MIRLLLISILLIGLFSSCKQDQPIEINSPVDLAKIGELDGLFRGDCFDFVYPVTYIMPDGSDITIEYKDGFEKLRNWYQENPGIAERPDFKYPLEIISEAGTVITVINDEELRAYYTGCSTEGNTENDCFELVYPVVYVMPDGSLIPVEYEEAASGEFTRWYNENPGITDRPVLQYPVEIIYKDGSGATINTNAEMESVLSDCD